MDKDLPRPKLTYKLLGEKGLIKPGIANPTLKDIFTIVDYAIFDRKTIKKRIKDVTDFTLSLMRHVEENYDGTVSAKIWSQTVITADLFTELNRYNLLFIEPIKIMPPIFNLYHLEINYLIPKEHPIELKEIKKEKEVNEMREKILELTGSGEEEKEIIVIYRFEGATSFFWEARFVTSIIGKNMMFFIRFYRPICLLRYSKFMKETFKKNIVKVKEIIEDFLRNS